MLGCHRALVTVMASIRRVLSPRQALFFSFYCWQHWVFDAASRLSLVAVNGGYSSLQCTGSVAVVHEFSCSAARGIFPDEGSNPCALHWQTLIHLTATEVPVLCSDVPFYKE